MPNRNYHIEIKGTGLDFGFTHQTETPGYVIDVTDYGASGNGIKDDTSAINAAIYTAPGGSVIRFSKGVYTVSSVLLRSNIDLYLEEGAEIRQNPDRKHLAVIKGYQKNYDYTEASVNATWEGNPLDCYSSLIHGHNVENVRIYGLGIFNGSGEESGFWKNPKVKDVAWRPRNFFLSFSRNITSAGITSRNSSAWNIHPFYSDGLRFYGLHIESDTNSPNTDGLNPESCDDVEIVGCRFCVGDDCIAIKSGKVHMARYHYKPSENITIRNCLMEEGHGGVVIGSEISCGAKNIKIEKCLLQRTDRGLRIKTRRWRGNTSVVEGIALENIRMEGVINCFTVNMFYNCDPDGRSHYVSCPNPLPVGEDTPVVRSITISGVAAEDISGAAIFLSGLPESPIIGVTFKDSSFSFRDGRETACPEMMSNEVLIPNLGVYMNNVEDTNFCRNRFEGTHVTIIDGKEEHNV